MSEKQAKRLRKLVRASGSADVICKGIKKDKSLALLRNSIPRRLVVVSKKRHAGESLWAFERRRKKSNFRRRMRERLRGLSV